MKTRVAREIERGDCVWIPWYGWKVVAAVLPEVGVIRLDFVGDITWKVPTWNRIEVAT